ncbi:MAG: T9SS type A sorting domain-containing protein [Ferruginibacter sp.]
MKNVFIILLVLVAANAHAQDPAYPPAPAAPLNLIKAEYFIDSDPGFGNGTNIPVTAAVDIPALAASINTAALTAGARRLYVRSLNAEGSWSITSVRQFVVDFDPAYPAAPATPLNIIKAEYFIDTDPGMGNGTNIPLTAAADISSLAASINTGSLIAGAHKLYLRSLNAAGGWSITSVRQFAVDFDPAYPAAPGAPQNITSAEYFIDTDPGFSNGINIPLTAAVDIAALVGNANTNLLPAGAHRLYIRSRSNEGKWSLTSSSQFIINDDPAYPAAPAAPGNITFAEYFVDTDPGFGNGTAITLAPGVDLSNLNFNANTGALTAGSHVLYVRSLDDWSITSAREFTVAITLPLHFISFTATQKLDAVLLNWTTGSEINTSHFEVEHSADGRLFETIGSTAAASTTGNHDYALYDNSPLRGVSYYRIKQVDKDGRFMYSAVIRVNNSSDIQLLIYPNPASQYLLVEFAGKQQQVQVNVYDVQGRLVLQQTGSGQSPVKINIEKLPPGKYLLLLKNGESVTTGKFIKQ